MSWELPVKTEFMQTQYDHEPSHEYAKDIYRVVSQLPKGFQALEIGAAWGISALAILEAGAGHLLSVDNNVNARASIEAKACGYDNHALNCVRSDQFWKENTATYDLVYIDGSHLYRDVVNDLYEGWKVVKPNGMLLVDDYDHKNNIKVDKNGVESIYGVSLAVLEFWRDHDISEVGITGRIMWFRHGS